MHTRHRIKLLYMAPLYALLVCGSQALAANQEIPDTARYEQVSPALYRGPQPSEGELNQLAAKGVKTIIDLRFGKRHSKEERRSAKLLGLNYIHMPLGYFIPSKKKIARILSIIRNPVHQPVFVHCRYGEDRTSMMVAIYRMQDHGVSLEDAEDDMLQHNFKPWLVNLARAVAHFQPTDGQESEEVR